MATVPAGSEGEMMRGNPHNYEAGFTIEQHRDELIDRLGKALTVLAAKDEELQRLRVLIHVPDDVLEAWAKWVGNVKCSACEQPILDPRELYRCYDCETIHHKHCLKEHIGKSDPRQYLCARRTQQEIAVKDEQIRVLKEALECWPLKRLISYARDNGESMMALLFEEVRDAALASAPATVKGKCHCAIENHNDMPESVCPVCGGSSAPEGEKP